MLKYKQSLLFYCLFTLPVVADSKVNEAFLNGNVDGEVKLLYYDINKPTAEDAYATALGGFFKYTTDTNNSIFASARVHTSHPVGDNLNKVATSMFNNDKDASSLTAISESYIAYKTPTRVMKVGNLMLNTPLMNNDNTRIVPWSYRGFAYTGETIEYTKVQLYYIDAIRSNTSQAYKHESASGKIGSSGITMLSLHYAGMDGLELQSYYYYAPELYSTFVAKVNYKYTVDDNTLFCIGMQYFNSGDGGEYAQRENSNGGDDINLLALKASVDSEDFELSLNYSQNFGISGIVKAYGGLAKVYTSSMIANGRGSYKPETWMLKSSYYLPFNSHDSEIALWLTNTKFHDYRGDDFKAYYLHFKHYFNRDTSVFFRYENLNYKTNRSDATYFRAIAKYRF